MGRGLSTFIKDMLFGDAQGLHQRIVQDFAESKAMLFNTLVSSVVCSLVHSFIHPSMFLVPGLFLSHFCIICVFLFLFLLFLFLLFLFVFLYVCLVLFESIYHSIYLAIYPSIHLSSYPSIHLSTVSDYDIFVYCINMICVHVTCRFIHLWLISNCIQSGMWAW